MRLIVEVDDEVERLLNEHERSELVKGFVSHFVLDGFGISPTQQEVASLCQLMFALSALTRSLWVCRRAYSMTEDYILAAKRAFHNAFTTRDAAGVVAANDDFRRYRRVTDTLKQDACAGDIHLVRDSECTALSALLHEFWVCRGGRWVFLAGETSIGAVLDFAEITDSTRRTQKMLRSSILITRLVGITHDDNIMEGLVTESPTVVLTVAKGACAQMGVDLET